MVVCVRLLIKCPTRTLYLLRELHSPDEAPPTPPSRRWPPLTILPTLVKYQLVWFRLDEVVLLPVCFVERTFSAFVGRTQWLQIYIYIAFETNITQKCPLNVRPHSHRVEVREELHHGPAPFVRPTALSRSHPRCHRKTDGQISPHYHSLANWQLVCRLLCGALLSSPPPPVKNIRLCCLVTPKMSDM